MNNKIGIAAVLIAFGLLGLALNLGDTLSLMRRPVEVLTQDMEDLHVGQHAVIDITMAYDALISVTTETTRNGTKVSSRESSRYYAVPTFTYDDEMIYLDHLILVEVGSENFSVMQKAVNRFDKWWDDETGEVEMPDEVLLSLEGTLRKLDSKEDSYVKNYFDDENYEDYMPALVIKPLNKTVVYIVSAIAIVMLAVGVLLLVSGIRDEKSLKEQEKQRRAAREAAGYYDPQTQNVTFNNDRTNNTAQ